MERKRVLLVDDEPEIVDVLRTYLEREGLFVETCGTVADALAHSGTRSSGHTRAGRDASGWERSRRSARGFGTREPYPDVDVDGTFR